MRKHKTRGDNFKIVLFSASNGVQHESAARKLGMNRSAAVVANENKRKNFIDKARRRALIMATVIVVAFSIAWMPYNVVCVMVVIFGHEPSRLFQTIAYLFSQSCAFWNPIVYGLVHLPRKQNDRKKEFQKTLMMGQRVHMVKKDSSKLMKGSDGTSPFPQGPSSSGMV